MLFDLSMTELMLIGVVALVVIGPKDLPKALRVAGYWLKKARSLSREFQSSVEQMIREAELDEMGKEFKKASEIDLDREFRNTIDPGGSLAESLKPPELPRVSGADLAAAPASAPQAGALPAPERHQPEQTAPGAAPEDAPGDPPRHEPPPRDPAVAPADPGNSPPVPDVQGGVENPAAAGTSEGHDDPAAPDRRVPRE